MPEKDTRKDLVLGAGRKTVRCPNCLERIATDVHPSPSRRAYLMLCCCGISVLGCLPLFLHRCWVYKHRCPQCNFLIGTFQPRVC